MPVETHCDSVPISPSKPTVLAAADCRLVVIEDDVLLKDLLAQALEHSLRPAALHTFASGRAGLEHALRERVDLLLIDLGLPDIDGREVIRQLNARERAPRTIVLTSQIDTTLPAELIALGVAGFVDKASPLEHAVRAVERVLSGGMYFFAGVMPAASASAVRGRLPPGPGPSVLTARERDVARLVAGGLSSKEIARRLDLSPRTVENYRAHILAKLGLRDTSSLVRWCVLHGLD